MNPAYLREALDLAAQSEGLTSPNPMVVAVLVRDNEVVGRGIHTYAGVKHAEILALEQAGDRARGAALYINIEPCSHQGRTGPCADALIAAGVKHVYTAMQDPNPLVAGEGLARLRAAGVETVVVSEFTAEAERINEAFVHFMKTGRPLVTLKSAMTLDGKTAAPDDNRGWITSDIARAHVQHLRHGMDAMITGIGTLLADDCLLNDRTGLPRSRPLVRVVLDSQLRMPLQCRMVDTANGDVIIATTSAALPERRAALEARGLQVETFDGASGRVDLRSVIQWLAKQKTLAVMIEAGAKLNWAALEAEAVDKVYFYYGAKILGGTQALPMAGGAGRRRRIDAIAVERIRIHTIAADEFAIEGYVHRDH